MAFKEVTGNSTFDAYWPKKANERKAGDEVVGVYKTKREVSRPDGGKDVLYMLEDSEGKKIGVNSYATIDRAMSQIPEGSTVKIVFQGKQRSAKTGREYNNFQVFVDDGNAQSDSEVDLSNVGF